MGAKRKAHADWRLRFGWKPLIGRRRRLTDPELLSLFDVSPAGDARGLDAYLTGIISGCARWFRASGASIFLEADTAGEFRLAAKSGTYARMPNDARIAVGEGIAGAAIAAGSPIVVSDPSSHALLSNRIRRHRDDLASAMVVPLATPDSGCVGVLNLSRHVGESPYTAEDLEQARSIAGHIALAITNARLMSRLGKALEETRDLRDRLAGVISSVGIGLIVVEQDGSVSHANPEARAFVGRDPTQGMPRCTFLSDAPEALRGAIEGAVRSAIEGRRDDRRAADQATSRAWSVVGSPMPSGGAVVAIHDVSALESAQREMARLARLADIGQMAATIAHEIRNPLTGIRGAAQVLKEAPEDAQEFGSIIEDEVLKLSALCDDFLDFAKPLRVNRNAVRLAEVLAPIVSGHRSRFENAGVALTFESEGNEPIIHADPLRLEQVAHNLLLNALQACGKGDEVRVRVGPSWFSIQDTGPGLGPEAERKLFVPFFTTKAQGTGLGLSTVRKIIEAHGGRVRVETAPGQGTRFTVQLNLEEAA